tara:strand:+ start:1972 stop:2268 length:297 start_codon:yes stop_codon:yes gene_type:complete
MRFIQIINEKKSSFFIIILFLYVLINLLDGERGLISYYEKKKIKDQLIEEKYNLSLKLASIDKMNSLLTEKIDLDYLEMLYRQKFMLGKKNEYLYKTN